MPWNGKLRLPCLIAAGLLASHAARAENLDLALVKEARERMAAYLAAVPDYVCSVSIDRYRKPARGREQLSDRLRLEVAFVGGKELYGLAGATRFDEVPLTRLITAGGSLSTGSYALHIREVFASNRPIFTAAQRVRRGRRGQVRLAFTIPRDRSQLRASDGNAAAVVGYSGEVFLDAANFRPIELSIKLDDIPQPLRFIGSGERTLYHDVRIAGREISLPETAELTILVAGGSTTRNRILFENCRNYRVESTISFEALPEPGSPAEKPLSLPRGSVLEVELQAPISKEAAIGEALAARVSDAGGLLPGGAQLFGNITRWRRLHRAGRDFVEVGLRFHSLAVDGRRAAFQGKVTSIDPPQGLAGSILMRFPGDDRPGESLLWVESRRLPLKPGLRLLLRSE